MKSLGNLILGFFLLVSLEGFAQQLKGKVIIPRNSVFVGEACEVRIEVSTTTWFTSGVTPKNLQIDGAYTIYFRPVSRTKRENGKTYSIVELIYNVFPYRSGQLEFPSLDIEVESPKPGEYKGSKKKIKTASKKINVKAIPSDIQSEDWLVCNQLQVKENWSSSLKQVKVGDVITRTISRTASGTIPEMIPTISWDTLSGASIYEGAISVESNKGKVGISAEKSESIRYLFEKEGEVLIPEKTLYWWNPKAQKLYKKTLKSIVLDVKQNPDLEILASIKDSLRSTSFKDHSTISEKKPIDWIAFSKKVGWLAAVLIVIFYVVRRIVPIWVETIKRRHRRIRLSEEYNYRQFLNTSSSGGQKLNSLYSWLNILMGRRITLWEVRNMLTDPNSIQEIDHVINVNESPSWDISRWKKIRNELLHLEKNRHSNPHEHWINP